MLPSLVEWVRAWRRMVSRRDKELRERAGDVARCLKASIEAAGSPWASWDAPTRARVLTVVQRCAELFVRNDGTTAAERLARKKHENLVAHLVAIVPTPARPRVRSRKTVEPMLAAA